MTENIDYALLAEYFGGILRSNGIKDATVLDLACGTGTLTVLLSKAGYEMIGADISNEMLSVAVNAAFDAGEHILFLHQSMQKLDLYGTVDAVICSLDGINHLADAQEVLAAFGRVSLFLNKDGVFVFDVNTVYKHREILGNNTFVYDLENVYCVWQNTYHQATDIVDMELDVFERRGKAYERNSDSFSERAYEQSVIEELLNRSGLQTVAVYDGWSLEPPSADSQRLVFVAKKL